ncbi:hypothetical protein L6R52_31785, partial [Myxococcota bacterium]|nr:hypothetical protein [Myxococcota bacterium]
AITPSTGARSAARVAAVAPSSGVESAPRVAAIAPSSGVESAPRVAAIAVRPLCELRGYRRDDLFAIAEVAHHYLFSGARALARTLFEGLAAVEPREPYFALAVGLACDHLGSRDDAMRWYRRASELDARDGRADVNLAELHLDAGDIPRARMLLTRGAAKAEAAGDDALARKSRAILRHLAAAAQG